MLADPALRITHGLRFYPSKYCNTALYGQSQNRQPLQLQLPQPAVCGIISLKTALQRLYLNFRNFTLKTHTRYQCAIFEFCRFILLKWFGIFQTRIHKKYHNEYDFIYCFVSDSFCTFRSSFPEWCESCAELLDNPPPTSRMVAAGGGGGGGVGQEALPLMGLRSLRISAPPPTTRRFPHLGWDSLSSAANSSTDSSDTDDRCDSSLGEC